MRAKFALLATIFAVPAAADPGVTIPETVITATRTPTLAKDIPAGVTAISRAEIEASGATTLADVLATVPGLHVSPSGGPGGQASVFARGTNSSHVLVLRDGMAVNDASDVSGAFNFGVDTLSDIERIEVIRGPMAALYGSGAIGGVINLISRRGTAGPARLEIDLTGGYPASIIGSAVASGVAGPFDYALTAESQSRRGFDSTPRRMSVYTGRPEGFRDRVDREPWLYAGRGHKAFPVPARAAELVRVQQFGVSDVRYRQFLGDRECVHGTHRRRNETVRRHV